MFRKSNSNNANHISIRTSKTNLYIKGLPAHFHDKLLAQLVPFENKIKSVKAAMDGDLKCKGYGFIDFINEESAEEAKQHIETNYSTYPVKYAKENEKDKTNLYVTNIPKEWTSTDTDKLKSIFEKYGDVQSVFIMQEKSSNKTAGVGFVRFSTEQQAEMAINWLENNEVILPNCNLPLEVKYADKHNPETRKRLNNDRNLKSYSYNSLDYCLPVFTDADINNLSDPIHFNDHKPQDFSLYPVLVPGGNTSIPGYYNILPYQFMSNYNPLSNPTGLWNINGSPYFPDATMNCHMNPFVIPANNFNSIGSHNHNIDYNNNKTNQSYIRSNHNVTE